MKNERTLSSLTKQKQERQLPSQEPKQRGPMKLYKIGQPWQNEHFYCQ
jgi:hypothetical protein